METLDLDGLDRQHPLADYVRRAKELLRKEGAESPVVVIDARQCSRSAPALYELKPEAEWQTWRSRRVFSHGDGCFCYDCITEESAVVVGESAAKPKYLGEESNDWLGHIQVEVPSKHGKKRVHIVAIAFGSADNNVDNCYLVCAHDADAIKAYEEDLSRRENDNMRLSTKTHIFVSDSSGVPRPRMSWDDIVLDPAHRETIERNIQAFFAAKEHYHRHGLAYRRGLLLVGPPGNGKTSVIRILASQRTDLSFFMFGFSNTNQDTSQGAIRALFDKAAQYSPSVVILEDIDRVANEATMRAFLNIMDGVTSMSGVFVLATSNHADKIDEALIERPSRFDLVIRMEEPKEELRLRYLTKKMAKVCTAEQAEQLAKETQGYSMAMLQELFTGALLESVLANREVCWEDVLVSKKRLDESLRTARKEQGKPAPASKGPVGFSGLT